MNVIIKEKQYRHTINRQTIYLDYSLNKLNSVNFRCVDNNSNKILIPLIVSKPDTVVENHVSAALDAFYEDNMDDSYLTVIHAGDRFGISVTAREIELDPEPVI